MSTLTETLRQLESVDLQLDSLVSKEKTAPERLRSLELEVATASEALVVCRGRIDGQAGNRRSMEAELAEQRDTLKKWEQRAASIRNTREQAAMEREIAGAQRGIESTELRLKLLLQELPGLEQRRSAAESALQVAQSRLDAERPTLVDAAQALAPERAALLEERTQYLQSLGSDIVTRYETVRRRVRGGRALAPLQGSTCSGCRRIITPHLIQRVQRGQLETCPHCARLLIGG